MSTESATDLSGLLLPPRRAGRQWSATTPILDLLQVVQIPTLIRFSTRHSVESRINGPYTRLGVDHQRQNRREWYWSRKMGLRHYIFEAEEMPVIVEVRRRPGGNFAGGVDERVPGH